MQGLATDILQEVRSKPRAVANIFWNNSIYLRGNRTGKLEQMTSEKLSEPVIVLDIADETRDEESGTI